MTMDILTLRHIMTKLLLIWMTSACMPRRGLAFTVEDETALRLQALANYSREVRPSGVTEVTLLVHVTAIASVDITNEIFSLSGWWSMRWNDSRLIWNNYPQIPVVQYNPDKIWTPVLVVSNSVDDLSAIDEDTIPIRVERNGVATWNPPALLKVGCTMDVTYFPFDTQTCGVEVTSFGFTIQELDLDLLDTGLSFRYFAENGEWTLLNTYSRRTTFTEDNYEYAQVTFFFEVKRKPLFYGLNMILPVIVCAFLTQFVFVLPAESGEKIGYCLTILLAFMVILTLVATDLPTTATNTSILEIYIAIVLIMGGCSVILSILVLHIFFKPNDKPVPDYVTKLTYLGMRICCYENCCKSRIEPKKGSLRAPAHKDGTQPDSLQENAMSGFNSKATARKYSTVTSKEIEECPPPRLIKQQTMYGFRAQVSLAPDEEVTWQTVAIVLDGILLRLYGLLLVISSVIILPLLTAG